MDVGKTLRFANFGLNCTKMRLAALAVIRQGREGKGNERVGNIWRKS